MSAYKKKGDDSLEDSGGELGSHLEEEALACGLPDESRADYDTILWFSEKNWDEEGAAENEERVWGGFKFYFIDWPHARHRQKEKNQLGLGWCRPVAD
jgi:hypothetical protein